MSILALDVGFRGTGWTVWKGDAPVACGLIHTTPQAKKRKVRVADDNALRSAQIARELHDVIQAHGIAGVVGELPSGGAQSAKAASQMAMATAIVASVVELLGLPSDWATPTEVKVALCGSKTASKDDMMAEARRRYGNMVAFPKSKSVFEHIADSIGAYLALRDGNVIRVLNVSNHLAANG